MRKNILYSVVLTFLLLLLASCGDMSDTYEQFTAGGETIYIGKADSLLARGGKDRIELSWLLLSDPKVTNYKIFWNNGYDSIAGRVTKTENVDTVRVILNNMPENVYSFDIYLYDDYGHSSIKSSIVGQSYGEFYEQSLINRVINSIKRISNDDVQINWSLPSTGFVQTELVYTNNAGEKITKTTPKSVMVDTLKNIPVKGSFEYRSMYLPEPDAIDAFFTPYSEVVLKD